MLQHREQVRIVADVIQEPLHGARPDDCIPHAGRTFDGLLEWSAREARDEELAIVEHLRKITKLRAHAEEFRPHGQNDVD